MPKYNIYFRVFLDDDVYKVAYRLGGQVIPTDIGGFSGRLDFAIEYANSYWPYGIDKFEYERHVSLTKEILSMTDLELEEQLIKSPGHDLAEDIGEVLEKMKKAREKYA